MNTVTGLRVIITCSRIVDLHQTNRSSDGVPNSDPYQIPILCHSTELHFPTTCGFTIMKILRSPLLFREFTNVLKLLFYFLFHKEKTKYSTEL